jgi:hypothetical protein
MADCFAKTNKAYLDILFNFNKFIDKRGIAKYRPVK